jgi:hypothetical protein
MGQIGTPLDHLLTLKPNSDVVTWLKGFDHHGVWSTARIPADTQSRRVKRARTVANRARTAATESDATVPANGENGMSFLAIMDGDLDQRML